MYRTKEINKNTPQTILLQKKLINVNGMNKKVLNIG